MSTQLKSMDSKKNILHILAPIKMGGGETLLVNLLKEKKEDYPESILLLNRSFEMEESLKDHNIKYFTLTNQVPNQYDHRLVTLFKTILKLTHILKVYKILKKEKINIFHIHGFPALMVMFPFLFIKKYQSVYTHHFYRQKPRLIERLILSFVYNKLSLITCVSGTVTRSFKEAFPNIHVKIETIYNCISTKFISTPLSIKEKRDKLRFIQIARFAPFKNQLHAIESLAKSSNKSNIELVFCGDGETLEAAKSLAKTKEVNAVFMGHIPNEKLVEIIDTCDYSLFPSDLEGFGIGAVESMARGLPVLAINNELMQEIIQENGVLTSKESLNKGFEEIIHKNFDPIQIKNYANTFSPQNIKNLYLELYKKL